MSNANDKQIGGNHYKQLKIQVWDFVAANNLDFFQGSAIGYIVRTKGTIEDRIKDYQKAIHFIEKKIELMQKEADTADKDSDNMCHIDLETIYNSLIKLERTKYVPEIGDFFTVTSASSPNKTDLLILYQCTGIDNIFVIGKSVVETEKYFIINSNIFYPGFSLL